MPYAYHTKTNMIQIYEKNKGDNLTVANVSLSYVAVESNKD